MHPDLTETLRLAQRLGFFGSRPIEASIEHSQAFVAAVGPLTPGTRIVDLGSGGGLPGLVVADAYRSAQVLLIDRRARRTDFLERAVARLGFGHVEVRCGDVTDMVRDVVAGRCAPAEVVTARGFGPPTDTLRLARGLLAERGRIVISEPPDGDRWSQDVVAELGLEIGPPGRVRVFRRFT